MTSKRELLATLDHSRQLINGMSQGRRTACVAVFGPNRGFITNLRDVFLPWPLPEGCDGAWLTLGLALQCSPTKELVSQLPLAGLTRREEAAVRWVETEMAIDWAKRELPGTRHDLDHFLPDFGKSLCEHLTVDTLMQKAIRLASDKLQLELPELAGLLPLTHTAIPSWNSRKLKIEGRLPWSDDGNRLERLARNSSAVGGRDGDMADRGSAAELAEQDDILGERRNLEFGFSYPEWNCFEGEYRGNHTLVREVPLANEHPSKKEETDPRLYDFFREPLQQRLVGRQEDGIDLDIDMLIEAEIDRQSDSDYVSNFYAARLRADRNAACAIVIDRSMSLGHATLLASQLRITSALSAALVRANEPHAVFAFHSDGRRRVVMDRLRDFSDISPVAIKASSLRPSGYTRIGAAIRHAAARLSNEPAHQKLLIILSDGVPCDEGYEGIYAVEDTAKAIEEAEISGISVAFLSCHLTAGAKLSELVGHRFMRISDTSQLAPALVRLRSDFIW